MCHFKQRWHQIRGVWEVGSLRAKTGLGHLEEIVEIIQISVPGVVEISEAEFLTMEIANAHFKYIARAFGVEVGVKSRKERGCVPFFCCFVLLFSDDFWLIWIWFFGRILEVWDLMFCLR